MSCSQHPQWVHGSEDCPICASTSHAKAKAKSEVAGRLSASIERLPTIQHDGVQWVNKTAVLLVIGALRESGV
jgi:hypothetical protein